MKPLSPWNWLLILLDYVLGWRPTEAPEAPEEKQESTIVDVRIYDSRFARQYRGRIIKNRMLAMFANQAKCRWDRDRKLDLTLAK